MGEISSATAPLKLWNGQLPSYAPMAHAWAAAPSFADLLRLLEEAGYGKQLTKHYVRTYWHAGCWGIRMDGITPERGLWVMQDWNSPVVKLYPAVTVRRLGRSRPS